MQADASVPWISHLFRTGEALALQALASDYTVSLQHDACGSSVEHSIRDAEGEKLGPSFRYKVLGVFGVEGRCVAFAPHHTPGTLVLAFRGTRVDSNAASRPGRGQAAPPSEDIKALLNSSMVGVKWLPDAAMRVHAGVHRHHADLWDAEHSTRGSSLRLDQLGEGLGGWLAGLCGADAPQQIVFVGLSLGAALAQMSALRLASEQPQLAARTSVLGLGSFQFANADVGRLFESLYGERAAQLVTARRMPARPPPQVQEPPRDDEAQAEALVAAAVADASSGAAPRRRMRGMRPSGAGRAAAAEEPSEHEISPDLVHSRGTLNARLAVDPITAAFGETVPLHGILFLRADVADECDDASAHEAAAQPLPARAGGLVAPPTALAALMAGRMAKQHALRLDYLELHLARHYRE
ncbi:hypothetical protein EMIHUDRAFT_109067 [Emiliania huxleyi CCMP1516]|uniref:Fungal lipase-type domain-containing protein n=2 Tax=Emiliania huxleyi TaxID=2903 RepID=A0A0D3KTG3_EMIH1|nr:hypothetical protein EMIHUDRAFT_109067 [Emiliania huxleyi CCMP1516]EOD39048.1 hypothetical protein EMIHUDRAFT_109067 [Emiliania huxleyi CCMP1516]|eukprot:XP_005791477.1 hypothetical protein EMIHUDRAFT_109067 [Emiliania huxleyi CCMP1516]